MGSKVLYYREEWSGDSRDGVVISGEGYHFFKMNTDGCIVEAYEVYETEEGEEIVTSLPEMLNVSWIEDLGFDNLDTLDKIDKEDFSRIKNLRTLNSFPAKNI